MKNNNSSKLWITDLDNLNRIYREAKEVLIQPDGFRLEILRAAINMAESKIVPQPDCGPGKIAVPPNIEADDQGSNVPSWPCIKCGTSMKWRQFKADNMIYHGWYCPSIKCDYHTYLDNAPNIVRRLKHFKEES